MMKKTWLAMALTCLLLASIPAQAAFHPLWGIPEGAGEATVQGIVQDRFGLTLTRVAPYGNGSMLVSDWGQDITMFGAPMSVTAIFEDGLQSITIECVDMVDEVFFIGSPAQKGEAIADGLERFALLAGQVQAQFGGFTGGMLYTAEQGKLNYPLQKDGALDRQAAQQTMQQSEAAQLTVANENIEITMQTSLEGGGPEPEDVNLFVRVFLTFNYGYAGDFALDGFVWQDGVTRAEPVAPDHPSLTLRNDLEAWDESSTGRPCDVSVDVPQVAGLADARAEAAVNKLLRRAVYGMAGTYEERVENTEWDGGGYGPVEGIYEELCWLEDAWISGDVLALFFTSYANWGGTGSEGELIIYVDVSTGQQITPGPLFRDQGMARNAVVQRTYEHVQPPNSTVYRPDYADVLKAQPWGYWLSPDGLTAVYTEETLDRRQQTVLIPWADIGPYMAPGNEIYAAVMAGTRRLAFE